jgi:hypothetical protein
MKVWATSFIVLFGLVELYQWVQHLHFGVDLPLPVFILGGAALAIASNYDKRAGLPFGFKPEVSEGAIANQPTQSLQPSTTNPVAFNNSQPTQKPELPPLNTSTPATQPQKPISFTIQRPKESESK